MKKTLITFFYFLLLPIIALAAEKEDICRRLATDREAEIYFSQHQQKVLHFENGIMSIGGSGHYGSCQNDGVWLQQQENKLEVLNYRCSYNGCGMGSNAVIVSFEGNIYVVTGNETKFESLSGWNTLSQEEQSLIRFRNYADTIYKFYPVSKKLISQCENLQFDRSVEEKVLDIQNREINFLALRCHSYKNNQTRSIFSAAISAKTGQPDISRKITLDIAGDKKPEIIAPLNSLLVEAAAVTARVLP